MAPQAKCQPCSPPPKSVTAPTRITIRPAAGPLMVKGLPDIKPANNPPIMAVTRPIIAGNSEALAIPKLSGNANRNTMNPALISARKFCFKPFIPSNGIDNFEYINID